MENTFLTISSEAKGAYREKGSRFMAFAYPVGSEEDIKSRIESLRKEYFDARHHCYAYRLGPKGELYRANDDREPSGSAGKPILGQLIAHDLTNVLVVVVRYFGGTLLGVGGLIQAYKQAAADALANAEVVTEELTETCVLNFGYPEMPKVFNILNLLNLTPCAKEFGEGCTIKLEAPKNKIEELKEHCRKIQLTINN